MESTGWSAEALATFWAAALAAGIGATTLVLNLLEARAARRRLDESTRREQWWLRWTWTMERLASERGRERRIGRLHVQSLLHVPWALGDDMRISLEVFESLEEGTRLEGEGRHGVDRRSGAD